MKYIYKNKHNGNIERKPPIKINDYEICGCVTADGKERDCAFCEHYKVCNNL